MAQKAMPLAEKRAYVMGMFQDPKTKQKIAASLANVGVTPERLISWTMTAFRREPNLLKCDPLSILGAVVQSAQLGLDPSGVTGEAYLVKYGSECTLIPGYKGLMMLARRSGHVTEIMGNVVREGDEFEYEYGLDSKLRHVPSGEPGPITHAYAYAKIKGGGAQFVVMPYGEIEQVRQLSSSGNSPAWKNHYAPMAIKTAVRRLAKFLPLKPDEARAFELAGQEERGEPQSLNLDDLVPTDAVVEDAPPADDEAPF
jgi:recombination protein RecT